ncbi:MAG: hypothetical protein ACFFCY_07245 [Promethearchaeota archaeon]
MNLDYFAKSYLTLGLRINKHIKGYVEHYYGPSEIKTAIDIEEKVSPKKLLQDCKSLMVQIRDQGFEEKRKNFLNKNLIAFDTVLRKLNGEKISYLEQVERLFAFKPILYKDDYFYHLTSRANDLYKGKGSLNNRIKKYSAQRIIPKDKVKNLFIKAINLTKNRTIEVFPNLLPNNESIEITEVENQSWTAYDWYQGNYNSRVEININRIQYWTSLLYLTCHEVYPGHHTERTMKDYLLYRSKGCFECSLLSIYTPEMVISEGIGQVAERVIFDPLESVKISLENFCANPEIEDSLDILIQQKEIREGFRRLQCNLAYYKYVDGLLEKDLIKYAESFKVIPEEGIKGIIEFISDELWGSYIMVYQGERLITEKFGKRPSPEQFRRLLTEQTLPCELF